MLERPTGKPVATGTFRGWLSRWFGLYIALLAVAWLVPAGLYDGVEGVRPTLFAFPLIFVVFAVPTTALLCVLRAVARKLPPPYFRVTAVLLLLPAAGPVFAVPSPLAIVLQLFIQVLFGLVVRRPPGARSL